MWNQKYDAATKALTADDTINCEARTNTDANCETFEPAGEACDKCKTGFTLDNATPTPQCKPDVAGCATISKDDATKCATCKGPLTTDNMGNTVDTEYYATGGDIATPKDGVCVKRDKSIANCLVEEQLNTKADRKCLQCEQNYYLDGADPKLRTCTLIPANTPNCARYTWDYENVFGYCNSCSSGTAKRIGTGEPQQWENLSTAYVTTTDLRLYDRQCTPLSVCSTRNYEGVCTGCFTTLGFYSMGAGRALPGSEGEPFPSFEQLCSNTTLAVSAKIMSSLALALIFLSSYF